MDLRAIIILVCTCFTFGQADTTQITPELVQNATNPSIKLDSNSTISTGEMIIEKDTAESVELSTQENRTISEIHADYDEYEYELLTSYIDEEETAENSTYYDDEDGGDRARWSFAPKYFVKQCMKSCQEEGKPFGRLLGARCQCLCPLNAPDLGLCSGTGKCDRFCASQTYYKGGDCLYNNVCFCYCKSGAPYDVDKVYSPQHYSV